MSEKMLTTRWPSRRSREGPEVLSAVKQHDSCNPGRRRHEQSRGTYERYHSNGIH